MAASGGGAPGLDAQAQRKGRFYGAAIDDRILAEDSAYMAQVTTECGMVTGETAFKWGEVRPQPGAWDWAAAEALVGFASRHGMAVRGHTLLWHEHNLDWLLDQLTPATAEHLLSSHVSGMAGRFHGRVVSGTW